MGQGKNSRLCSERVQAWDGLSTNSRGIKARSRHSKASPWRRAALPTAVGKSRVIPSAGRCAEALRHRVSWKSRA